MDVGIFPADWGDWSRPLRLQDETYWSNERNENAPTSSIRRGLPTIWPKAHNSKRCLGIPFWVFLAGVSANRGIASIFPCQSQDLVSQESTAAGLDGMASCPFIYKIQRHFPVPVAFEAALKYNYLLVAVSPPYRMDHF